MKTRADDTFNDWMRIKHPNIPMNAPKYHEMRIAFFVGAWALIGMVQKLTPEQFLEATVEVKYALKKEVTSKKIIKPS